MGEIKSTLELIMEKTKGLTMTGEEKHQMKQEEMAGMVRGLVQKYLDGILSLDRLRNELADAGKKDPEMSHEILLGELKGRLEPGSDNEPVLKVMESIGGMDTAPVRDLLEGFEERFEKERASRSKGLLEGLSKKGISGSALIPNLNADPEWKAGISKIRDDFQENLEAAIKKDDFGQHA